MNNFMIQDIVGVFLAFILFPLLLIAPGYTAARAFNLLQFNNRSFILKMGIALLVSSSISPSIFFLTDRVGSRQVTLYAVSALFVVFLYLLLRDLKESSLSKEYSILLKKILMICGGWVIFAILFLVDIQWGNRLYYNIASFDYSTRAAVIDAITRTGVPPINPGYFPGQPQHLTFLYYFWYVLCSVIDQLGGKLIDARMALMASIIWTGLALFSAVGVYILLRSPQTNSRGIWQKIKIGLALLLVSGLDILPSTLYILFPQLLPGRLIDGDIEQWNEQITAWIGSVTWTPHHVISVLACLTVWILIASSQGESWFQRLGAVLISGFALASAAGLSIWVTLVFAVFWFVWLLFRIASKESILTLWTMMAPGLIAGIAILPFILDLLGGSTGGSAGGQFPLSFRVREFYPFETITFNSPAWEADVINLIALPINYFLELGFFSAVGIFWFQYCRKEQKETNRFLSSEIALFITTLFLVTFVRSTVIAHNDFGWRGWMFAQFILVTWGVDLIEYFWGKDSPPSISIFRKARKMANVRKALTTLIITGIFTTTFDIGMLRFWPMIIDTGIAPFPRIVSRDAHLGERTFAAREAFTYVEKNLPANGIVQFSPKHLVDTLSGLYRANPAVIAYNTLFGVSPQEYEPLANEIQDIFNSQAGDWNALDSACSKYKVDALIIRDIDPLWKSINQLKSTRRPLTSNSYFVVFTCGQ